jgi:LmbE family N-acetylglucosaminyl deacetylase
MLQHPLVSVGAPNDAKSDLTIVDPPQAASCLVIAAHPDDLESWCAGTIAAAIDRGSIVRLLLVTSGDKGSNNPDALPAAVAACREAETRAAASVLGLDDVGFLRYPDAEVEDTLALRRDLVTWIRRWRPDTVLTHDPVCPLPRYTCHRDHRVVGRVALDAVYPLARDALTFPALARAGLAPHAVRSVWLFATEQPDVLVDISNSFERKVQARLAHASQTSDPRLLRDNWRKRAAAIGAPGQLALGEAFAVLTLE